LDVHLILANHSTNETELIRNWLAKQARSHLHADFDLIARPIRWAKQSKARLTTATSGPRPLIWH
jgi:hypothetical protein